MPRYLEQVGAKGAKRTVIDLTNPHLLKLNEIVKRNFPEIQTKRPLTSSFLKDLYAFSLSFFQKFAGKLPEQIKIVWWGKEKWLKYVKSEFVESDAIIHFNGRIYGIFFNEGRLLPWLDENSKKISIPREEAHPFMGFMILFLFFLFHELAHIYLKHSEVKLREKKRELQADRICTSLMRKMGVRLSFEVKRRKRSVENVS